jgi:prepilin-type processing-associated H-X9-DG protein
LIELIVVVAAISILLMLSVWGLRIAREQARAVGCASNLRQLLLSMSGYAGMNGTFPPGYMVPDVDDRGTRYAGIPTIDAMGRWWFDHSLELNHLTMDGVDVLRCPSNRQTDPMLSVDLLCGNYGANLSICRVEFYLKPYKSGFRGLPLSVDRIRRPSETLLLVDSGYSLISWWHATEEPPVAIPSDSSMVQHTAYVPGMSMNRSRPLWAGQAEDAIGGRHPNKTVNVGFVDGSVGIKTVADDLLVTKTNDVQWKNDNLWQPLPTPVADPVTPTAPTP